ncbi:hypothetical protein [Salinigranum marinum]|uniref:hypothetical protein n=1 Tax=Salinigranum marinum TaxID=1515595 RepID=UPI002989DEA2|nr:hypothetical protein [Salinigranum marinum]
MSDVDPTRRSVLLAAGLGVGISAVFALDDGRPAEPDVSYGGDALRGVVDIGTPTIPRTFPVEIGADHVAANRNRARSLLASAPETPDIPNEAAAREYTERYEEAVEALERAHDAQSPYERLDDLQSARWYAADVSAVYAAFEGEVTREDVLARREPVRERLAGLRDRWRYVGDDLAVALSVHRELESRVDYAERTLERVERDGRPDENHVLHVGSIAGTVELARTAAENATYYYDRFVEGLAAPRPLGGVFDRTARVLVADATAQCPDPRSDGWESRFDRDLAHTVARPLLRGAFSEVEWRCRDADEARERQGVATTVLTAATLDRDLRALDRVRRAVDRGRYGVPRSVDPVRREKLDALAAVETARDAAPESVASGWARGAVGDVQFGDRELTSAVEHDRLDADQVAEATASYAWGRARSEVTPGALSRLTGVLDAAATDAER